MTCLAAPPKFRLLDGLVGWDVAAESFERLAGEWDASGVRLMRHGSDDVIPPAAIWPYLPPPRLAYDCGSCTWFLVTPAPPSSRLLSFGPCDACDQRWRESSFATHGMEDLVAVAVHQELIAVADRSGEIRVWERDGARVGSFPVADPTHLAFVNGCELVVVAGARRIWRFDPAGIPLGHIPFAPDAGSAVAAIGGSNDGSLWLMLRDAAGQATLRRRSRRGGWKQATLDDLRESLPDTGLHVVAREGFCVRRHPRDRTSASCCFTWYGRPASSIVPEPTPPAFVTRGQLLTRAIDSRVPRCRWHRLRIDADVPVGTGVEVAVATADVADQTIQQGAADPAWPNFETGIPHPLDWQRITGADDVLIDQPPGQFLYVRLRLTSTDGVATPVVRSLRLDFPRATSLDALPSVYREDPQAEDFTERFLALFDATLEDLDTAVERLPALLDIADTPAEVLPWLGSFLGVAFDPEWDPPRRRRILAALPALYARRGTPAGLADAVKLVFDVDSVIEEITGSSVFSAVASLDRRSPLDARLGATRLFGRSRVRFRLGASALSKAPLRAYGDPSLDAVTSGAFRFRVLVPAIAGANATIARRLRQLVDSQKPAHVVASVRIGSPVPVLGAELRVGIDTHLGSPAPPILGARGNVRLRRDAILRGRTTTSLTAVSTSVVRTSC